MAKFFRCTNEDCGYQFVAPDHMVRANFKCGAVAEYVAADNPEASDGSIIPCLGIKPLGCGGEIKEISQKEAMEHYE